MNTFDFNAAQSFELSAHRGHMLNVFKKEYERLQADKQTYKDGLDPVILSERWEHNFFNGNLEHIAKFIDFIKDKKSLDVGCGCIPWTKDTWKVKHQIMLDPLLSSYNSLEKELFGCSFFDECETHNTPAENIIESLVNTVDGFIMCRNTIDHSDDPLSILNAISKYAMDGCYLLFWADIWHYYDKNDCKDDGHHSITHSAEVMDKLFNGLGFKKIIAMNTIRDPLSFIDYGGVFIKNS